jgi:hypothetical protein
MGCGAYSDGPEMDGPPTPGNRKKIEPAYQVLSSLPMPARTNSDKLARTLNGDAIFSFW